MFQSEQAFGTLAGRLVAQGLVDRRPGHGRRIEHHLTAEGRRLFEERGEAIGGLEVRRASLEECRSRHQASPHC